MSETRPYRMKKRARQAAQTVEDILDAFEALMLELPVDDITLAAIAERADCSVQTIMRRFGSRQGLFDALGQRIGDRIDAQRGDVRPGDIDAAVQNVLEHYEEEGRLVLRLLAQEHTSSDAREGAERGRAYHREWVEVSLGPLIETDDPDERHEVIDALVAATDLYTWKLLRLDLGRSRDAVRGTVERLVRSVISRSQS